MKEDLFDMTVLSEAVRSAREKLYPSPFPLKNSCQSIYSERVHSITVDKTN